MEPKSPTPQFNGELPALPYESRPESGQSLPSPEHEQPREQIGGERIEQRSDAAIAAAVPATTLPAPVLPVVPDATVTQPVVSDTPLVAGDDDLIEKEWVDKAKQIIEQTKDDPYRREQEVSRLQAEYLKKRYGKELNTPQ
jgi:hypothetical protein